MHEEPTDSTSRLRSLRGLTRDVPALLAAQRPRITVIGDVILDGWWHGDVNRLCREAPAPVVELAERSYAAGGAANTAVNLAALGAEVTMVAVVGRDDDGDRLVELLRRAGVGVAGVLQDKRARTVSKIRIVSSDQILLRIDGAGERLDPAAVDRLGEVACAAVADADAVMVCDYASGNLPGSWAERLRAAAGGGTVFVVDAHDGRTWSALQPDMVTPNASEAAALVGSPVAGQDRHDWVRERGPALLAATGARSAVVTLDREGTVLVDSGGRRHRTWARPVVDKQTAGAGDTFAAALTLGLACGVPVATCLDLAQAAADIVVHRSGTSVCSTRDLAEHLDQGSDRVLPFADLAEKVQAARAEGRRVVLTNGCFDVLHRGHTTYLNQARQLGDLLVVAINSDDSVRRLKGPTRPLNSVGDRAGVLAALSCVDYVCVFDDDTPIALLRALQPDVYAKGGDYTPQMLVESVEVQAYGGRVEILDYVADHSTTALVERISARGVGAADLGIPDLGSSNLDPAVPGEAAGRRE